MRTKHHNKDDLIEARVTQVNLEGPRGPYFFAFSEDLGTYFTCSLDSTVWQESRHPNTGEIVMLSDVTKTGGGLRANSGRFWRMSDQE
jgi:hypothetical protein